MYDSNALKIYIDGSALKNPGGFGGIAGIVEYPDKLNRKPEEIFRKGYRKTTNQRMELRACIKALEWVRKNSFKNSDITRIIIITDSLYVSDNQSNSVYWKKDGWRDRHGKPISNKDLWNKFLLTRTKIKISLDIMWGKGKSSPILKEVDKVAKKVAKSSIKIIDNGYIPGRVCVTKTSKESASLFPAQGQEAVIRIYRHRPINKKEYEIAFDLFCEEENKLIEKYYAYVSNEEKRKIHLRKYYRVKFNKNSRYPIFYVIEKIKSPSI